jgi:hypothetical protein
MGGGVEDLGEAVNVIVANGGTEETAAAAANVAMIVPL